MFDSVGKNIDEEQRKRQAWTLGLMLLLGGLAGVTTVGLGAFTATKMILEQVAESDDMIEVVIEEAEADLAPPPPPPPPPPPAAADEPEEEEEPDEEPDKVNPDEMVEDVQDLEEDPSDKMQSEIKPAGVQGGVEGGVEGGVVGGVMGGIVGGELGGQLGPRVFHHSEVQVKRRVVPEYPAAAKDLNLGDVDCKARVFIDEEGTPFDIQFEACPRVFHQSTRDAIMKWRWYPAKVNREKVQAQFIINVKYKLK
ncbi:MAG: energy transducer TonB [Deltaproteobacteria bacterium]|nr:energy transducer TonB [Deltaproteobacteria bacterium]